MHDPKFQCNLWDKAFVVKKRNDGWVPFLDSFGYNQYFIYYSIVIYPFRFVFNFKISKQREFL